MEIAPQTLGRCVAAHLDLLAPLAEDIHENTRGAGLLATDATDIPILDPEAPEGIRSGTMWGWTNALWVSFFYRPSDDANGVRHFLGEGNYARASKVTEPTCSHSSSALAVSGRDAGPTLAGAWCCALALATASPYTA